MRTSTSILKDTSVSSICLVPESKLVKDETATVGGKHEDEAKNSEHSKKKEKKKKRGGGGGGKMDLEKVGGKDRYCGLFQF